jgi:hypothetical protein
MQVKDVVNSLKLGTARATLEGKADSPLAILLQGVHQEVVDQLGEQLERLDAVASNRLKQSLVTVDLSKDGEVSLAVSADFYWKFVNYGVNGTQVNHGAPAWGAAPAGTPSFKDSISEWIRDRGIRAKQGQTYEQLTYAVMAGVRKNGIAPRPFVQNVINKELKQYLTRSVSQVMRKAITINIKEPTY